MNIPFITTVIANYNYGKYIGNAIDSVFKQKYPHDRMALFIVDDNSTDDSWNIIYNKLFKGQPHENLQDGTRIVEKEKIKVSAYKFENTGGPSRARNHAIRNSLEYTDFFAILDADDEMYPNKFELCVNQLLAHSKIGSVYGDYDILNVNTGIITREYKEPFDRMRLEQECIVHSGSIIRKDALVNCAEGNEFYDESMRTCEDYDLWMRISDKYMIYHIPNPLTLVRVTPANSTATVNQDIWNQNYKKVFDKANKRCHT